MNYLAAINISDYFKTPFSGTGGKTVADLVLLILEGALAIAGVVLLVFLIGAGIAIIGSAGKPEQASKGAKTATSAIIGFIIVFATYLIVQLVGSVLTGNNNLIISPK